jgi:dTDP-4-dehydrorhamnose reductase
VTPVPTQSMPRPAPRPAYSVLDLESSVRHVGPLPHWTAALQACLDEMRPPGPAARSATLEEVAAS